jgi:hypothetical protein
LEEDDDVGAVDKVVKRVKVVQCCSRELQISRDEFGFLIVRLVVIKIKR